MNKQKTLLLLLFSVFSLSAYALAPKPQVHFYLVAQNTAQKDTLTVCEFQRPVPDAGCKKVTVSNEPLFIATDLRYAELIRKRTLGISNSYNTQSSIMLGQVFEDLTINLVFKKSALAKLKNHFKKASGKQLAIVINNEIFLLSQLPPLSNNTFIIKKNMDIVLARNLVDAITNARQ